MSKIRIGTNAISYLEKRNFIDLPYSEIEFVKVKDYYKILTYLRFKLTKKTFPDHLYSFKDGGLNKVDILHFFSALSKGEKPWVVTSSVPLPRWTKNHAKGIQLLANDSCKKIILISDICKQRQLAELEKYPDYKDKIIPKITVLHPSQNPLIKSYSDKKLSKEKIVFSLVGHQILIKGGLETLRTFSRLHQEGFNVQLNLVSLLHSVDYLKNENSANELNEVKTIVASSPSWLNYFPSMPNDKVIELLKTSHVALLPSYGDSYGYSVLESQACGCPVISTDIVALPEINNEDCGWIINVPKLEFGKPDVYSLEKHLKFSQTIENQLYNTIISILNNRHQIELKGNNALNRIINKHNPTERALYLENLYRSILNK